MIQRIQTVYFVIVMLLLSSLLSGVEIFGFPTAKSYLSYSVYGIQQFKSAANAPLGMAENIWGRYFFTSLFFLSFSLTLP